MRHLWALLSLLLMAGLWWLSSRGGVAALALPHPLDWLARVAEFLVLGFALGRATGQPAAWVVAAWFGALDGVYQAFLPGQSPDVTDWLADLLGAWVGSRLGAGRAGRAEAQRRVRAEQEPAA